MGTFGVAAKGRISVVSDSPTGPLPPGVKGMDWFDTSSPTFWVAVWFLVLLGLVYLVFHGLIF